MLAQPNQRQVERVVLQEYMRVHDCRLHNTAGYVLDISTCGMQLVSRQPFRQTNNYHFYIECPGGLGRGATGISLTANLIWRGTDPIPEYYDAGFQFVRLNDATEHLLLELMDRHAFLPSHFHHY